MKAKPIFLLLVFIVNFSLLYSCSDRKPKTIKQRKKAEENISQIQKKEKLLPNESLLEAIKLPGLLPSYAIASYKFLDEKSLYQKINGAADGYIANHGFSACAYVEIKHKLSNAFFIVYIYDMVLPIQAFGIYSSERNPDYNFIDIDNESYQEGSTINFWKGKYYVKIELQSENREHKKLLLQLATRLSYVINKDNNTLDFFRHLPKNTQIKNTRKYYLANYEAQALFKKVYEAKYNTKNTKENASLFISSFENQKNLQKALSKYREFLSIPEFTKRSNIYYGKDSLENKLYLFSIKDNYLIGAKGLDKKEAFEIIRKTVESLSGKG